MIFQVMNRQKARNYTYQEHGHNYIIVSISDIGDQPNQFNRSPECLAVLKLQFNDTEKPDPTAITPTDAEKIIAFVNQYIDQTDEIIVHCEGGVSRSAGVCAALMYIITGDDQYIFDNPKFCPNMTCYTSVLTAYFGSYDKEQVAAKARHSIEVWRKVNDLD